MAVSFLAQTTNTFATAATVSTPTITISGSNVGAVVILVVANATGITPTCVWDPTGANVSGTNLGSTDHINCQVFLFGFLGISGTTKTFKASWTGSHDCYIAAVSYTGVEQSSTAAAFTNFTSGFNLSVGAPSLAVTSATGNATVAGWGITTNAITTTSGTTVYIDNNGAATASAGNRDAGAATVTMTISPNNTWVGAAINVVAAAASGDTFFGQRLRVM